MRYLMLIKHPESDRDKTPPAGLYEAMGAFVEANLKSGVLVDTNGLKPTKDAKRVRQSGGKIVVLDGPFTEAKEMIGGYAIVEARSPEHAMEVANAFMQIHLTYWPDFEGECEVRPVEG
jgi:hypothetical protein